MSHWKKYPIRGESIIEHLIKYLSLLEDQPPMTKKTTEYHPPHLSHDDVIQWNHFPRYWPFVWGINRSPVNSPHKGQWRGALMFSLICTRINDWVNNREAGDLRRHLGHYDVNVMLNIHWLSGGFDDNICMLCNRIHVALSSKLSQHNYCWWLGTLLTSRHLQPCWMPSGWVFEQRI